MEYGELVNIYEKLERTSKRLEKVEILSSFLKKVDKKELKDIVYLSEGRIFPEWDKRKIGFNNKLMIKALSSGSGEKKEKIEELFRKRGDLGLVAEEIFKDKKQTTLGSKKLNTEKVLENIRKLASLEGKGTVNKKIGYVSEILVNAGSMEAKYIAKTILENLRIGVSSGIIRDSIAKAFDINVDEIEHAADLNGDYGAVAELAKSGKLKEIELEIGKPIKCMLALITENIKEGFEALGKPAQFESKIDGFRLQCHFDGKNIKLFTRNMEDVTKQFPDVAEFLKKHVNAKNYIIDAEAVGYEMKTKKYLPFQSVSQRIKRKYDIKEMSVKFPVELNAFDVLYCNNQNLMNEPLKKRREILEKIIKEKKGEMILTSKLITEDEKKANEFFEKSLKEGYEGVMIKNLNSEYQPGRYVNGWVKLKNILEPLDLTIIKCFYGEGKRTGWLTSYVVACRKGNEFLEVGKVSTGIKEKNEGITYKEMTKLLKPLIKETKGTEVIVKPKIVVEVAYEEIQKSPTYSSGFALRFPRVKQLRLDKGISEINNLSDVERIYKVQKKG